MASGHPDFKTVEGSRPPFPKDTEVTYVQTPDINWAFGSGSNTPIPSTGFHSIDPFAPTTTPRQNYKFLISAITPRPIALISTLTPTSPSTGNIAPFSWFNMMCADPPMFAVGFASPMDSAKDTLYNLITKDGEHGGKCVVNIMSESYIEAANSCSVDAPRGVEEWGVSGLTKVFDTFNGVPRAKEAVISIECELVSTQEFDSVSKPGSKSGTMAVLKGTRFWVRKDAMNETEGIVDLNVLKPVSRLGGISYGRTTEVYELQRPDWQKDVGGEEGYKKLHGGNKNT